MSLAAQIAIESRRYSGWTDPRYPIGYWQAALRLTGNASGGLLGIDLLFQLATAERLNSQMYSVERLTVTSASSVNRIVKIAASNMGGPGNVAFTHQYSVELRAFTNVAGSALLGADLTFIPWFLGSQRQPAQTGSVSLIAENIDGVEFTFEAEGYRWSPRSVLVDGGPQRPPTGLYAR